MLIATISDLHLGFGDRADLFQHRDDAFLSFLDYLEDDFERIVLLGDVYETLTSHRYMDARRSLARCRQAHPKLVERFERPKYSFVHGNHDIVTADLERAPEELVIKDGSARLLFVHGHQSDPIVMRHRWLSELGVWAGGWVRRAHLDPIYRAFSRFDRRRGGVSEAPDKCLFQRFFVDVAKERGADVVVTGHTHVAVRAEHGDRLFLNGGCCAETMSFVAIDTRAGNYEVRTDW